MNKIHFHPGRSLCHAGLTGGMSLNTEIVIPLSLRLTTTKQLHKLCIQRYHIINMIHHPRPTCVVPHRFDRCNQNVKGYSKYKLIVTSKCLPNQLASSASIIRTAAQLQKVQHQKLNIMLTPGTATTGLAIHQSRQSPATAYTNNHTITGANTHSYHKQPVTQTNG